MRLAMTTSPWDFGIGKELRMVDEKLRLMVQSSEPKLTEASMHVIGAGGKRMRPTVTILAYKALGGKDTEQIVDIATGFELIHSATLVHDDINDGGLTRRGRETVYRKFGLHNAIITGDFLFVKAFALGGQFDRTVVSTTADACAKLAEGEILQNRFQHKNNLTIEQYVNIMQRKTAEPIRAGAMVGAYLAGGGTKAMDALGSYGLDLGIAFQIVDDILDFTGDEKKTGKPVGTDLKEGYLTLPSLIAMRDSAEARKAISSLVKTPGPSSDEVKRCAKLVIASGAIEKARAMSQMYGNEALQHLDCLPDNQYSRSLRSLVSKVLERDS